MTGCTTWATRARGGAGGAARAALVLVALAGADPAGAATAADLRDTLERAGRAMRRARDAAEGRDPARVSLLLMRADEEMALLEEQSGAAPFAAALDAARAEAAGGNLAGAAAAIERARGLLPALADFVPGREAEVAARAALAAAGEADGAACAAAIDRLEAAALTPVLRARMEEARRALARARAAMVRRDLAGGRPDIDAALAALDGLRYAGALNRAAFALTIGAEMLREKAILAAQDQTRRGLREIRKATGWAAGDDRAALETVHEEATVVWRRMSKPRDGDSETLAAAAARLLALRAALAPR